MARDRSIILWRIFADLLIFLSVFVMPWWFTVILVVGASLYFPLFFEALLFGALTDFSYGIADGSLLSPAFRFTLIYGLILIALEVYLKKRIILYDKES